MKKILKARLLAHERPADGYSLMKFDAPGFAGEARPGQFVMVRVSGALDPLLSRPFSILDADGGGVRLLVKAVGFGTRLLTRLEEGADLLLLGPLGSAFPDVSKALLIGGGYGMAPLYFFVRSASAREGLHLFYGARADSELLMKEAWGLLLPTSQVHYSTEDGSRGFHGLVTGALGRFIQTDPRGWTLLACGPMPMLKAVHALAERHGLPCFVSVDEPMACGYGVCLGCVVPTRDGYKRSCQEGPIFDSRDLLWEAL
jgi:dihydroorotate dehydrogenase electron transfer subunit